MYSLVSAGVLAPLLVRYAAAVVPMPHGGMPAAPTNASKPVLTFLDPATFTFDMQGETELETAINKTRDVMANSYMPYLSPKFGAE